MDVLEVLRAARALLSDPARWRQGCGHDGGADTHCVASGVWESTPTKRTNPWHPAISALCRTLDIEDARSLYDWNDSPERTHADILALFDRAIAVEEAKQAEFDTGASHALLAIAERETVVTNVTVAV